MLASLTPAGGGCALVTGASSGIGREFARQLAARGWPVVAVARRADRLEALAAEARAAGGVIHPVALDVTEPDALPLLMDRVRSIGPVRWLVNNAGIARAGPFGRSAASAHLDQLRLNCEATLALTAAFLPAMLESRQGIVLNVGSLSGFQPTPGFAVYGATKAFLLSFTEALREELRGSGVRAMLLCTPSVSTELVEHSVPADVPRKTHMFMEISAERCVSAALAAADRGDGLLFVSWRDRCLAGITRLTPRSIVARVSRRLSLWWVGLPDLEHLPPWHTEAPRSSRSARK